jgi:hypothetical protein
VGTVERLIFLIKKKHYNKTQSPFSKHEFETINTSQIKTCNTIRKHLTLMEAQVPNVPL